MCIDNLTQFLRSFLVNSELNRAVSELLQKILNIAQQSLFICNMSMSQIPLYLLFSHLFQCYLPQNVLSLNHSVFTVLIQDFLETASSEALLYGLRVLCPTI